MKRASLLMVAVLALAAWATAQTSNAGKQLQITHGPVVEQVTSNSAIVAWTTNVPSSAILHYGTTNDPNALKQSAEESWGGQKNANQTSTHRVHLKNPQPNTTYYVQAESGQGQGTGTGQKSSIATIHTTAPGAPPQQYPNGR